MKFVYSEELVSYMNKTDKHNIVVEIIICNNSEIEIADLHVYLIDDKRAAFFKEKKGYGFIKTEYGEVLIPKFKLHYDDVIYFDIKTFLFFRYLTYKGIFIEK